MKQTNPKSKISAEGGSASGGQNPKLLRGSAQVLFDTVQFNGQGLVPAVIQDAASKRVLTLCYLNRQALKRSLREGKVYVFRRSQNRLMLKGETSGHIQTIKRVEVDCEGKSLLLQVSQRVAACHAGYFSCYFRRLQGGRIEVVGRRVFDPAKVYRAS